MFGAGWAKILDQYFQSARVAKMVRYRFFLWEFSTFFEQQPGGFLTPNRFPNFTPDTPLVRHFI